jgi:hypothetical protein
LICAAIMAVSILLYGVGPWIDWLVVAPKYLARIAVDPRYRTAIIAPTGLAIRLGVTGWPLTACRIGLAVAGAALAAGVFRRESSSPAFRLVALVGGSLLAAPYAMNYETALLAPAAALAVCEAQTPRRLQVAIVAYVALALAGFPNISAVAFLIFLTMASIDFAREAAKPLPS